MKESLFDIKLFHTDRGSEFGSALTDEPLASLRVGPSMRMKGCPYDNAVAESASELIKAEFDSRRRFPGKREANQPMGNIEHECAARDALRNVPNRSCLRSANPPTMLMGPIRVVTVCQWR